MKMLKKVGMVVLALAFSMAFGATAFAQDVASGAGGNASITVNNASKGETYSVYKLFDATVTGTEKGSIAYSGTIPESLEAYFTADSAGNISATDLTGNTEGLTEESRIAALKAWAGSKAVTPVATGDGDGSKLTFTGLTYGYYVITSTQGKGANITVTSTNPNAVIYDKNSTSPTPGQNGLKTVDDDDVSIGDTVTYTINFKASNHEGSGEEATQITEYVITDTLPNFLSDVKVTSVKVGEQNITVENDNNEYVLPQFDEEGKITLSWVDESRNSKYANGVEVTITYTGVVNDKMVVGGGESNENEVKVTWTGNDNGLTDKEVISTYAAAIQKITHGTLESDEIKLAGAEFAAKGLTVTGSDGLYTVVSYDPNSTTLGTTMQCDANGYLIIKGLDSTETLRVTETKAPDGYNKLNGEFELTATKTTETTVITTDDNTKVITVTSGAPTAKEVVNNKGEQLPSTGGMGTTLFYVVGGLLVVGAAVTMVVRKRMTGYED